LPDLLGWLQADHCPSFAVIANERHVMQSTIFLYIFYHDFAKIYGPSEILQNYTSAHYRRTIYFAKS
jgi:hypothetical protein